MQASGEESEKEPRVGEALLSFAQQRGIEPGLITRLLHESEPFQEICTDYEECCAKLNSLEQESDTAGGPLRDYLEMRDQLEQELRQHLEASALHRARGSRVEQTQMEQGSRQITCTISRAD